METKTVTIPRQHILRKAGYVKADEARICLKIVESHKCGGYYVCAMEKGHENSADVRLQKHQAACRKHHLHIISWTD